MKIIGWTSFDSECQGICSEEKEVMLEALNEIIRTIREKEYLFSGQTHQTGHGVVPVFDNGKCVRASMRGWAMLMSIAHTGDDKSYMDFYMDQFISEEKLPENEANEDAFVFDKAPKGLPYYYVKKDLELVAESVGAGMQLMTYDKVVLVLYEIMKKHMESQEE